MIECSCKCDHWLHLAMGFQGIVGMMVNLDSQGVACSKQAMEMLEIQMRQLAEQIEKQRRKTLEATPPS